ncbi:unnamed protein product [Porites lobata]|uniref:Pre-mRNA-splicing factor SPF27 n=1 Tax=Porites lobata TaxID=104759 RepID=A0ABN8MYA4_9CNID|nr:unnamed protein product [Porites lobata]
MAATHEVAPDALPYFDQGYDDPGVREMVNQLVEEETRRYRPTKNYLDFLPTPDYDAFEKALNLITKYNNNKKIPKTYSPNFLIRKNPGIKTFELKKILRSSLHMKFGVPPWGPTGPTSIIILFLTIPISIRRKCSGSRKTAWIFHQILSSNSLRTCQEINVENLYVNTPVLKKDFERISKRQAMELLSMKRYELPQPTANQKHDITSWTEAVDNSMAQLEHQAERIENLELLSQYGGAAWKIHNETLTRILAQQQKKLMDIKKEIQEINWQRKTEQTKAGEQLQHLEQSWVGLVSKNYEIERACAELEAEIERLKPQHQQEER